MNLRSKFAARIIAVSAFCGCYLTSQTARADRPYMMDDFLPPAKEQQPNINQVPAPAAPPTPTPSTPVTPTVPSALNPNTGAPSATPPANSVPGSALPLQGKAETKAGSGSTDGGMLQGKTQSTMLKCKTQSTALQGGVHATGVVLSAIKLHMTQNQLNAATAQYANDLRQFYLDAKDYHLTSEALKKQIGECTENEQQWQAKLSKDKLQLNNVVIATGITNMPPPPPTPPDIPPPRVCCVGCLITGRCGHLGTGGGAGGASGPNATRADAQNEAIARGNLAKTQADLGFAEKENNFTQQKALDESKIEQSQQNLAEKFERLKFEYDTLKVEKEALTGVKVK
jgi:hypothetical protein